MKAPAAVLLLASLMIQPAADLSAQMRDPEIGAPAPSFTLPDDGGQEHSADFDG